MKLQLMSDSSSLCLETEKVSVRFVSFVFVMRLIIQTFSTELCLRCVNVVVTSYLV